ncbi:hypothetical protein RUM44_006437 [Polyplax serrata]|uniref:Uncharacterized protein n=1 Tax=Polyplax serrata TaxID=468196 RepID=A0ABR1AJM2_POLSC
MNILTILPIIVAIAAAKPKNNGLEYAKFTKIGPQDSYAFVFTDRRSVSDEIVPVPKYQRQAVYNDMNGYSKPTQEYNELQDSNGRNQLLSAYRLSDEEARQMDNSGGNNAGTEESQTNHETSLVEPSGVEIPSGISVNTPIMAPPYIYDPSMY